MAYSKLLLLLAIVVVVVDGTPCHELTFGEEMMFRFSKLYHGERSINRSFSNVTIATVAHCHVKHCLKSCQLEAAPAPFGRCARVHDRCYCMCVNHMPFM